MKNALKFFLSFVFVVIFSLPNSAFAETRWRKNMLLIYVPQHEYEAKMNSAFKDWESRLRQKIQFYNTRLSKTAAQKENLNLVDIEVAFQTSSGEYAENAGMVNCNLAGSGAFRYAQIVIVLKELDDATKADPVAMKKNEEEIYTIMLRQVGKALGLADSPDPNSVMHEIVGENQTITQQNIDDMFTLYRWPVYRPLKSK